MIAITCARTIVFFPNFDGEREREVERWVAPLFGPKNYRRKQYPNMYVHTPHFVPIYSRGLSRSTFLARE
jgi:hypothetical protein